MNASQPRTSSPLSELQHFLVGQLQRHEPVTDDPEAVALCEQHVAGNERVTPAEQVDIYRRQFWMRHLDVLREDFPGLSFLLGDDDFERWGHAYLEAYPPKTPSLRDLGADASKFSDEWSGFPDDKAGLARDMARYELSFVDVFDAADPQPLDPQKIAAIPEDGWNTARIIVNPLVKRLRFTYPVQQLRWDVKMMHKKGHDAPALPEPAPCAVALFRKDLIIHFEVLDDVPYRLIELLDEGQPLIPACEKVMEGLSPEQATELNANVGIWFKKWARWGWFLDVAQ